MSGIPQTVTHVATQLHLPVEGLIERSLQAYLRQEIRATQLDIGDFQDRYQVMNSKVLYTQIEQGKIYSHPAWEDSIEWEHLEAHLAHVKGLLEEMGPNAWRDNVSHIIHHASLNSPSAPRNRSAQPLRATAPPNRSA